MAIRGGTIAVCTALWHGAAQASEDMVSVTVLGHYDNAVGTADAASQYFLRGFNLDHGTDFATWVDGVPVNRRSHAHGQGYSDLNFLIPELVQRIDCKKGSYFADEGDFSSAGRCAGCGRRHAAVRPRSEPQP
ncbi:TonB-dependent Receptor Plug Domain [Duganella sp. CF402]|uniref:TonB-dependent receptor plug domain-containing protein n=1 Tax=unclassified Duganella TaxID=2636909 RepID=UPI0008CE2AC0|nr:MULTISPECIES: Plug domain-containing protein [unclassified Duganella]RZT05569.1 TonB-dependent receptor-like protein [Duganella sp. BK701]SEM99314.1 TonB-dependent Receptor Plug Domain [Duganella sp. CF402]